MRYGKHAYMILAHNNFPILEKLIKLLDDERNDIYIHINKKVKNFDFVKFKEIPKNSKLVFIDRIKNNWGAYSQIKAELSLLRTAVGVGYDYYHFLSGVDLPLKTQDYIHDFFDKNFGKEFVHFDKEQNFKEHIDRIKYYHFFQLRPESKIGRIMLRITNKMLLSLEKLIGVDRLKKVNLQLRMGSDWFSITDSLAKYILSQDAFIEKVFKYTRIGDEIFIQTLVWSSEFRGRLYDKNYDNNYMACLRYVDWERGKPYVWRLKDYDELMNSDYLFARKFDTDLDFSIVKKIYDKVMENQQSKVIQRI